MKVYWKIQYTHFVLRIRNVHYVPPKKGKEITVYNLSCDEGQNFSSYPLNVRDFYGLKEGDETLWPRLNNDIKSQDNFTLTLHIGDNVYCDDIYTTLLSSSKNEEEMITHIQEHYRTVFNRKTLSTGSHLFMQDDHEVGNDVVDQARNDYLISLFRKVYRYYQFIMYKDPDDLSTWDIYIDDYAPLGIAIPDLRINRQYITTQTKYPILSQKQMDDFTHFFSRTDITSAIVWFSIPLIGRSPFLVNLINTFIGSVVAGGASPSRLNQRDEILDILTAWNSKLIIVGGDTHYGMLFYLTNVITVIITSGISSYPPKGVLKFITFVAMKIFQPRFFNDFVASPIKQFSDFNYLKIKVGTDWNFNDIQKFQLKTYLRTKDTQLTINYKKSYSFLF